MSKCFPLTPSSASRSGANQYLALNKITYKASHLAKCHHDIWGMAVCTFVCHKGQCSPSPPFLKNNVQSLLYRKWKMLQDESNLKKQDLLKLVASFTNHIPNLPFRRLPLCNYDPVFHSLFCYFV